MPRLYSLVETHEYESGEVDFINGAGAIGVDEDTTYFVANSYAVDENKHILTVWDKLDAALLQEVADFLGVDTSGNTKQEIVREIETTLSAKYITALTPVSIAGTEVGDTKVSVTGEVSGDNQLYWFTGAAVATPLYLDKVDTDVWTAFTDEDDITPTAGGDTKITVIEANSDGYIISIGNDDLTVKV